MAWQLKQSLASKHRRGGTSVSFFILKSRLGTVLQSLLVYTSVCLIHKTKQPSVFYHITLYWAHWGLEPIPGSFGWDTPSPPPYPCIWFVGGIWSAQTEATHTHGEQANATEKPPAPSGDSNHCTTMMLLQSSKSESTEEKKRSKSHIIYLLRTITKLSHE